MFDHEKPDVYRVSVAFVAWAYCSNTGEDAIGTDAGLQGHRVRVREGDRTIRETGVNQQLEATLNNGVPQLSVIGNCERKAGNSLSLIRYRRGSKRVNPLSVLCGWKRFKFFLDRSQRPVQI